MQSQNYFYQKLIPVSSDSIRAALANMPEISDKTKAHIIKALGAGNGYYARHELANCFYSNLTQNELGIDRESAIWQQWQELTAKK